MNVARWYSRYFSPTQTGSVRSRNFFVELPDATHAEIWQTGKIAKPAKTLQHFWGGTAASIPVTESEQRTLLVLFGSEPSPGFADFESRHVRIVSVPRIGKAMRQDTAAIDAFPPVEIVGKRIPFVPSQFMSKKIGNPGGKEQLRQVAVESERVG